MYIFLSEKLGEWSGGGTLHQSEFWAFVASSQPSRCWSPLSLHFSMWLMSVTGKKRNLRDSFFWELVFQRLEWLQLQWWPVPQQWFSVGLELSQSALREKLWLSLTTNVDQGFGRACSWHWESIWSACQPLLAGYRVWEVKYTCYSSVCGETGRIVSTSLIAKQTFEFWGPSTC